MYIRFGTGVGGDLPTTLGVPTRFELASNYSNPVLTDATIKFVLSQESQVRLVVYNIAGQRVRTLVSGHLRTDHHKINWNVCNEGWAEGSRRRLLGTSGDPEVQRNWEADGYSMAISRTLGNCGDRPVSD